MTKINKAIAKNAFHFLAQFEGVSIIFTEMLLKFIKSYYSFFLKNVLSYMQNCLVFLLVLLKGVMHATELYRIFLEDLPCIPNFFTLCVTFLPECLFSRLKICFFPYNFFFFVCMEGLIANKSRCHQ